LGICLLSFNTWGTTYLAAENSFWTSTITRDGIFIPLRITFYEQILLKRLLVILIWGASSLKEVFFDIERR
jgi:hypothetical protein